MSVAVCQNCTITLGSAVFSSVAPHGVTARQFEASNRSPGKVHHPPSVGNAFLKFHCRSVAITEYEIGPLRADRRGVGYLGRSALSRSLPAVPLHQRVQRESLVEFGGQLLRSRSIACSRQSQRRHARTSRSGASFNAALRYALALYHNPQFQPPPAAWVIRRHVTHGNFALGVQDQTGR